MPYTLPRPYLSHSQVETYLGCPWKYQIMYVQKRSSPTNGAQGFGQCIHSAGEKHYRALMEKTPLPQEEILAHFLDRWPKYKNVAYNDGESWAKYCSLGAQLLSLYLVLPCVQAARPLLIEHEHVCDVGDGLLFKGVMDLVTEEGIVIDLKTSAKPWTTWKAQEATQLTAYTMLLQDLTGATVQGTRIHCLAKTGVVVDLDGGKREAWQVEQYKELLHDVANGISHGVFNKRTHGEGNNLCDPRYCHFYAECQLGRAA